MTKEEISKDEKLKADLFSADDSKVLETLKKIGENGSRNMVDPILELLTRTDSEEVKELVISQLSQLKIGEMEDLFISKLQMDEYEDFKQQLVFCMWHSGMNPVNNLDVVVKLAIEGDFMMALEVLTLIENMEGPFDHESLIDAFSDVSLYMNDSTEDDPKLDLMKNIYELLYSFQED